MTTMTQQPEVEDADLEAAETAVRSAELEASEAAELVAELDKRIGAGEDVDPGDYHRHQDMARFGRLRLQAASERLAKVHADRLDKQRRRVVDEVLADLGPTSLDPLAEVYNAAYRALGDLVAAVRARGERMAQAREAMRRAGFGESPDSAPEGWARTFAANGAVTPVMVRGERLAQLHPADVLRDLCWRAARDLDALEVPYAGRWLGSQEHDPGPYSKPLAERAAALRGGAA